MATFIAFLRAINLGATRTFPKNAIIAATVAAGGTDVVTHLTSGNVRLTSSRRSAAAVAKALEEAYAADRGFDVPTIVLTAAELAEIAAVGADLEGTLPAGGKHYVTLYAAPPPPAATAVVQALTLPGERCVVRGRAAYALLEGDIHSSPLLRSKEFNALGQGTARTQKVLAGLAEKWCG
jgi:uncharacterized protein (DUF1697 family)